MYLQLVNKKKSKRSMHLSFTCTKIRKNHFTMKNREWVFVEKMEEIY